MELRGGADAVGSLLQGGAVGQLGVFELLDTGEVPIDQHVIGERPEMRGGLQLGGVGRQEEQVDVLGHLEPLAGVPAGAVGSLRRTTGAKAVRRTRQHANAATEPRRAAWRRPRRARSMILARSSSAMTPWTWSSSSSSGVCDCA